VALGDFSLRDVYHRNAQLFPDNVAFIFGKQRVTHSDYLRRIKKLAAGLARLGVSHGDRVGILSHNSLEMVDLIGAVALLGAVLLPINFRLSRDEIAFVLSDGAPVVIVAGAEYQDAIVALRGQFPPSGTILVWEVSTRR
jgi:acyl-CoA synthetase (AMP-forming)/AMP-acid ligase II